MPAHELKLGDKVEVKQFQITGTDAGYITEIKPDTPYPYYLHSKPEIGVKHPDMGPYSASQIELIG